METGRASNESRESSFRPEGRTATSLCCRAAPTPFLLPSPHRSVLLGPEEDQQLVQLAVQAPRTAGRELAARELQLPPVHLLCRHGDDDGGARGGGTGHPAALQHAIAAIAAPDLHDVAHLRYGCQRLYVMVLEDLRVICRVDWGYRDVRWYF